MFTAAILLGNGLVLGSLAGPIGAFISEQFPADVRYTGASLAYQLGSTIGAGFTPMIAAALMLAGDGSTVLLMAFWVAVLLVSLLCILRVPEGTGLPETGHTSHPAGAQILSRAHLSGERDTAGASAVGPVPSSTRLL